MFNLAGKVALVTGASQVIGRATALALAEAGAKVGVAARNVEKLLSLVAEIEDWMCCGATAAHSLNHKLAQALPDRQGRGFGSAGRCWLQLYRRR